MAVSFEDVNFLRWARSASGVNVTDTNEVDEPPGGSKDTGFTDGGGSDTFYRNWVNWFFQTIGVVFEYFRDALDAHQLGGPQLARAGKTTGTANATGTSGSTTVTEHTIILNGRAYIVPETVVPVAVQNTLPTMHRIIVGRLVATVMTLVLVDGTVDAEDPTLNTGDVALWRVVQATGSSTYTLQDMRRWGEQSIDRGVIEDDFRVGLSGAEAFLWDRAGDTILMGGDLSLQRIYQGDTGATLSGVRLNRKTCDASAFIARAGAPTFVGGAGVTLTTGSDVIEFGGGLSFPPGSRIKNVEIAYSTTSGTNGMTLIFSALNRTNGVPLQTALGIIEDTAAGTGHTHREAFDRVVGPDESYSLRIDARTNHGMEIHSVVIEYEDNYPFRGWPALP